MHTIPFYVCQAWLLLLYVVATINLEMVLVSSTYTLFLCDPHVWGAAFLFLPVNGCFYNKSCPQRHWQP